MFTTDKQFQVSFQRLHQSKIGQKSKHLFCRNYLVVFNFHYSALFANICSFIVIFFFCTIVYECIDKLTSYLNTSDRVVRCKKKNIHDRISIQQLYIEFKTHLCILEEKT